MKIVPELEELNKAVRAPNDANGCTARLIHVVEDERMMLAPLVNQKMSRQRNIQWYDPPSKVSQGYSRS